MLRMVSYLVKRPIFLGRIIRFVLRTLWPLLLSDLGQKLGDFPDSFMKVYAFLNFFKVMLMFFKKLFGAQRFCDGIESIWHHDLVSFNKIIQIAESISN